MSIESALHDAVAVYVKWQEATSSLKGTDRNARLGLELLRQTIVSSTLLAETEVLADVLGTEHDSEENRAIVDGIRAMNWSIRCAAHTEYLSVSGCGFITQLALEHEYNKVDRSVAELQEKLRNVQVELDLEDRVRVLNREFDEDSDGRLSPSELYKMPTSIEPADANTDGRIDKLELVQFLRHLR